MSNFDGSGQTLVASKKSDFSVSQDLTIGYKLS